MGLGFHVAGLVGLGMVASGTVARAGGGTGCDLKIKEICPVWMKNEVCQANTSSFGGSFPLDFSTTV